MQLSRGTDVVITQAPTIRCDCGRPVAVTPCAGGYEFAWACPACARAGVISWAHAQPPPTFSAQAHGELFDDDDDEARA
jgi:hypothetical protein